MLFTVSFLSFLLLFIPFPIIYCGKWQQQPLQNWKNRKKYTSDYTESKVDTDQKYKWAS